jgi:hypothetical protein
MGVLFQLHHPRSVLRGGAAKQLGATAVAGSPTVKQLRIPAPLQHQQQHEISPDVNSLPLDSSVFRVVVVAQQIVTV